MEFCEFCQNIPTILFTENGRLKYKKLEPFSDTVSRCRLCELIYPLIDLSGDHKDGREAPFVLFEEESTYFKDTENTNPVGFILIHPPYAYPYIRLAIWCDEGSPISKLPSPRKYSHRRPPRTWFTTQRPILTNDYAECLPLISTWLQTCLSQHQECSMTLSGSPLVPVDVDLPTRVLHIKSITPELDIELLETKGMTGRYCALSHCWGPKDKQPLRTLKDNLEQFSKRIPPDAIPKTFQDALIITKGIGIDYLWIDSLCIIQDDTKDWQRQSDVMGSLYEKATLMIAASDAPDSSKGCCSIVQRWPEPKVVTMPLINEENQILGELHFSALPRGECDPEYSLLNKRAWAFQERHMSRRKIYFMPGGIAWQCKEMVGSEQDYICQNQVLHQDAKETLWLSLLSRYSGMDLTLPEDRLPAIQGIATEIDKRDRDGTRGPYNRFGVWVDSTTMPIELLWRIDIPSSMTTARTAEIPIPTWSWAHIESKKDWYLFFHLYWDKPSVEKTYTTLVATDPRCLKIRGYLDTNIHPRETDYYYIETPPVVKRSIEYTLGKLRCHEEVRFFRSKSGFSPPIEMILSHSQGSQIVGMAAFDSQKPRSNLIFSVLASTTRNVKDQLRFFNSFRAPEWIQWSLLRGTGIQVNFQAPDKSGNTSTWKFTIEDKLYHALMLEPVDNEPMKFRRVGVAIIYRAGWDAMDKTVKEFEIV